MKSCLNKKSLNLIYSLLMYPNLMYCASVWGLSHKTQPNKNTVAQKKIFRIVRVSYCDHSEPIYDRLKIFKFVNVPIYVCLLMLFKIRKI